MNKLIKEMPICILKIILKYKNEIDNIKKNEKINKQIKQMEKYSHGFHLFCGSYITFIFNNNSTKFINVPICDMCGNYRISPNNNNNSVHHMCACDFIRIY